MLSQSRVPEAPDPAAAEPSQSAGSRKSRFARNLLLTLLIPALLYPIPFFLVTRPGYEQWESSQWGPMLEYAFDARPAADVVIFGDSSAFLGLDPHVVNRELGIRSVVLPDTVGSLPVTGDAALRSYLAHNPPPRVIVLYFTAWDLDFGHIPGVRYFEGEQMMLRHMSRREIWAFTWHHPAEMLQFPFRLYSTFGPKVILAALHHVHREQDTARSLGHVDFTEPFPALTPECRLPDAYLQGTGTASVEALVHRYTTPQTRVLVYLAPVPECRNTATVLGHSYANLGAAPPVTLPASDFVGDPYYAHVEPAAVPTSSLIFSRALGTFLHSSPSSSEPGAVSRP